MTNELDCPRCGSSDTRRLSVVYAEGTGIARTNSVGIVAGELTPFIGAQRTQSTLAAMVAPPQKQTLGMAGLIAIALGAAIGVAGLFITGNPDVAMIGGLLVLLIIFGLASISPRQFNRDEYPRLMREWQAKFLCRRCGETFTRIPAARPSEQQWR